MTGSKAHPTHPPGYPIAMEETDPMFLERYGLEPVGLMRINHTGSILETNAQGARILKLQKAHQQVEFAEYLSRSSQARFREHLNEARHSSRLESCRVELKGPDGGQFEATVQSVCIPNGNSLPEFLMTLQARQLSLHSPANGKHPEPPMKITSAECTAFEAWSELTSEAVLLLSSQQRVQKWNSKAEELFPPHEKSILGQSFAQCFKTARARKAVQTGLEQLKEREQSQWETTVNGRQVRWTVRPIPSGFIAVGQDDTELTQLERRVLQASEHEQTRIAQELHDGLGQQLVAISFLTEGLIRRMPSAAPEERSRAVEIRGLLAEAVSHTRDLAKGFLPADLSNRGLVAALHNLARQVRRHSSLCCRVEVPPALKLKSKQAALHIYRIIQEAVQSATQREHTQKIWISLRRHAKEVEVEVKSQESEVSGTRVHGMSLHLMQYHAHRIGAELSLHTEGHFFLVRCRVACALPIPS